MPNISKDGDTSRHEGHKRVKTFQLAQVGPVEKSLTKGPSVGREEKYSCHMDLIIFFLEYLIFVFVLLMFMYCDLLAKSLFLNK